MPGNHPTSRSSPALSSRWMWRPCATCPRGATESVSRSRSSTTTSSTTSDKTRAVRRPAMLAPTTMTGLWSESGPRPGVAAYRPQNPGDTSRA